MKRLLLLALTAVMMAGCSYKIKSDDKVVVMDSCEYVTSSISEMGVYSIAIAHKGNCRFCKERRQKELEELVIKLKEQ